jgi:hypothetical protein
MNKLEQVRQAMQQAVQSYEKAKAAQRANNGPAQPGDVFLMVGIPDDCPLSFAILRAHPDNKGDLLNPLSEDLFFCVPCDDWDDMVGICDIEDDNEYLGPLVARCGYGFWMCREDLPINEDDGRPVLSGKMLSECRQVMANMARGKLEYTNEQRNVDDIALTTDTASGKEKVRNQAIKNLLPRSVDTELQFLLDNYDWERIDDKYPRSVIIPCENKAWVGNHNECDNCGYSQEEYEEDISQMTEQEYDEHMNAEPKCTMCSDLGYCAECDGDGQNENRIKWTNADFALTTKVDRNLILLMVFGPMQGSCKWISLNLYPNTKELVIDPKTLRAQNYHTLYATSSNWDGGYCGSGIKRLPESLRGFMYRTNVFGDAHILPNNIIDHLLGKEPSPCKE